MSENLALASRITESLFELDRLVERALRLRDKAMTTGDDGYWDGVALNLHGFYTGVEQILTDIAQTVDTSVPTGSEWHRDLLLQMSAQVPAVRPPVLARDTRRCLDEYRGFRHVVRNVYTFNLRPSRLRELVDDLPQCLEATKRDLTRFVAFLEQLDRHNEQAE